MINEWLKQFARLNLPIYQSESDSLKIVYAGYSSIKRNYFFRLILNQNQHNTFLGRKWFWEIPDLLNTYKLDLVISEISPVALTHFQKYGGYIFPEWTTIRINIDRPLQEICHKNTSGFHDIIRRVHKNNLTYELLSDKESFTNFYDKFYRPYMTNRHGDEAWIENLNKTWESSPSLELLAIKENGIIVGIGLIRKSKECLYLMRLGLLNGDEQYRNRGVIGAMYYFGIIEGQKIGCRYLDLGGTRPFLTDGLTTYKMRLGGEFVSDLSPKKEYLWLGINKHSNAAIKFLDNNPFMYVSKDFKLFKYGEEIYDSGETIPVKKRTF